MIKKILNKVEKELSTMKETVKTVIAALTVTAMSAPTYASASQDYLNPINNLKDIGIAIVAAAGVIVLLYGGVKFAVSFQKMDQNGEHQAIYTIIAGGVMVGISAIVTALTA